MSAATEPTTASLHDRITRLELWIEQLFSHTGVEKPAEPEPETQPGVPVEPPPPGLIVDVEGVPHQMSADDAPTDAPSPPDAPEASHTPQDHGTSNPPASFAEPPPSA
jgi:hypothetical protein